MVRLTRAQQQERTRAAVLVAARREFAEYGYGEAKIDRIAERAELTRGAVYSNFAGKRALYLAVLADAVERARASAEPRRNPPTPSREHSAPSPGSGSNDFPSPATHRGAGISSCARCPEYSTPSRPEPRWPNSSASKPCCSLSPSNRTALCAPGRCAWQGWH